MAPPLVSIVVPLYRDTRFLSQALQSISNQTLFRRSPGAIEILIVQDGEDLRIEHLIPKDLLPQVRLPVIPHAGVSAARNHGIRDAQGEWVAFLDADDIWLPKKLERQLEAGKAPGVGLVYANTFWTDAQGQRRKRTQEEEYGGLPAGWIAEKLLERNYLITSTVLARKSLLDKIGPFDESLEVCEDWELWIRIAEESLIAVLEEPLAEYRLHGRGAHTRIPQMLECSLNLVERHYSRIAKDPKGKKTGGLKQLQSLIYQNLAGTAVFSGDSKLARQLLKQGSKLHPLGFRGRLIGLLSFCPAALRELLLSLRDRLPFLP